jgi:hypothetical protein
VGCLRPAKSTASTNGGTTMTLGNTQLFTIAGICLVSLVINSMVQTKPLWKWVGVGLSALALLIVIAVLIVQHVARK